MSFFFKYTKQFSKYSTKNLENSEIRKKITLQRETDDEKTKIEG